MRGLNLEFKLAKTKGTSGFIFWGSIWLKHHIRVQTLSFLFKTNTGFVRAGQTSFYFLQTNTRLNLNLGSNLENPQTKHTLPLVNGINSSCFLYKWINQEPFIFSFLVTFRSNLSCMEKNFKLAFLILRRLYACIWFLCSENNVDILFNFIFYLLKRKKRSCFLTDI